MFILFLVAYVPDSVIFRP